MNPLKPRLHVNPLHALAEWKTWMALSAPLWGWGILETGKLHLGLCGAATLFNCIAAIMRQDSPDATTNEPQS
jgi:hypothetical protein